MHAFNAKLAQFCSDLFAPNGVTTVRVLGDEQYRTFLLENGFTEPAVEFDEAGEQVVSTDVPDGLLCCDAEAVELFSIFGSVGRVLVILCADEQLTQLRQNGFELYEDLTATARLCYPHGHEESQRLYVLAAPNRDRAEGQLPYCELVEPEEHDATPNSERVFVGMPTYDGRPRFEAMMAMQKATRTRRFNFSIDNTSFLAAQFSRLWAQAVADGYGRFVMLHDDVCPHFESFADILMQEQQETGADVVATVIPIKNHFGTTSTAVEFTQQPHGRRVMKRLTLHECINLLPMTFNIQDVVDAGIVPPDSDPILLPNTGCWLARLGEWSRSPRIDFNLLAWIDYGPQYPRGYMVHMEPEDWRFGRALHALGRRLVVTRKVVLTHVGTQPFGNVNAWGTLKKEEPFFACHWERDNPHAGTFLERGDDPPMLLPSGEVLAGEAPLDLDFAPAAANQEIVHA